MKILLFSFALLGVLTFSGCNKQAGYDSMPTKPVSNLEVVSSIPEIETTVDDLNAYDSSDEILTDIDEAMEDLDNL